MELVKRLNWQLLINRTLTVDFHYGLLLLCSGAVLLRDSLDQLVGRRTRHVLVNLVASYAHADRDRRQSHAGPAQVRPLLDDFAIG